MDILKLGLILGGVALLNKKQPSSIGKMHDKKRYNTVPCRNGRYSDAFPTPGACSSNGGVNMEDVYHQVLANNVSRPKDITVRNNTLYIKFDGVGYHGMKRLYRIFSSSKEIESIKSTMINDPKSFKSPLDLKVKFRNNEALKSHFLRRLKNNY